MAACSSVASLGPWSRQPGHDTEPPSHSGRWSGLVLACPLPRWRGALRMVRYWSMERQGSLLWVSSSSFPPSRALAQSSRLNNARRSIVNDSIHHVAITVDDIPRAIAWYKEHFTFDIAWQDDSWALLAFKNTSIALVKPSQHPPHIAFVKDRLSQYGTPVPHRDGTASVYIQDSEGNTVEMLSVPECEAS